MWWCGGFTSIIPTSAYSLRPVVGKVLQRGKTNIRIRTTQRIGFIPYHSIHQQIRMLFASSDELLDESSLPTTKKTAFPSQHGPSSSSSSSSSSSQKIVQDGISNQAMGIDQWDDESTAKLDDIQQLTKTWRDHPMCNPTIAFKSWIPPDQKFIQTLLHSKLTQPYLASRLELLDRLNVRLRIIHHDTMSKQKLILLHPDTPANIMDLPGPVRDLLSQPDQSVQMGPPVPIQFTYQQFTANYLLEVLLPLSLHPPPTAFETVGHVAHLNLRNHHLPYKHLIGQVLLETIPNIETVIHKVGEVCGPYRTYPMEVLAGRNNTIVQVTESNVRLEFDLCQVYWCSRLSQERQRLLRDEILIVPVSKRKSNTIKKNKNNANLNSNKNNIQNTNSIILADVFCGVGALCIQAAQKGIEVWANDWNHHAVNSLRKNAERNHVSHRITNIQCGDAYDYLTDLGLKIVSTNNTTSTSTSTNNKNEYPSLHRLPDHIVMNYPLEAPRFLGALRWWPADTIHEPRIHVYTFARADGDELSAQDVAVNQIADNLLPSLTDDTIQQRRQRLQELNNDFGCNVRVHDVRDVAPGKVVFCVSFTATKALLRCMQGDF